MAFYSCHPQGKLAAYVSLIWHSIGYEPESRIERALPNGSPQLILNLDGQAFRHFRDSEGTGEYHYESAVVTGLQTQFRLLDSHSRMATMGAVLKPGALNGLFGIPAHEFQDQVVNLRALCLPRQVHQLMDRISEPTSARRQCTCLVNFLEHQLDARFRINPAIWYAFERLQAKEGNIAIAEVREQTGYSRRRFADLFKQFVGSTPKQYARLLRFQRVLGVIGDAQSGGASLAIDCGFYDQSHLIHEFKSFAGLTPTEYRRQQGREPNHVPVKA